MIKNIQKIICLVLCCILALPVTTAYAKDKYYAQPTSVSHNRLLPNGQSIDNSSSTDYGMSPMTILYKEVCWDPNTTTSFTGFNYTFAYIYGTTVQFVAGSSTTYTLTVDRNVEKSTSSSFSISLGVAETAVRGDISSTDTAYINQGEVWNCGFTTPGRYNLTWYMRGWNYDVYADVKWTTTDANDQTIHHERIGTCTKPTSEITFDISNAY